MKIYTIVVTYNGEFWIRKCLNSLQNSSIPVHIIVVDNKSTDKTIEIIVNEFPAVELLKSDKNLGFGKGNNIGLRMALFDNADYVFLLNQDAFVEDNSIENLIKVSISNKHFGILSGIHFKNSKEMELYFSSLINPFDCPNFISNLFTNNLNEIYPIKFVHAACWLITKNCLQEVGLFDPIFPHYGEDEDYIQRAKYFGFEIGIAPSVKIYHDYGDRIIQDIRLNINLLYIQSILILKRPSGYFIAHLIYHLKDIFDKVLTLLIQRRLKEMKTQFVLFCKVLINSKSIYKTKKKSLNKSAYI